MPRDSAASAPAGPGSTSAGGVAAASKWVGWSPCASSEACARSEACAAAARCASAASVSPYDGFRVRQRLAVLGEAGDAQHGDVLAVAVLAAAVLPAALLEDDDLVQPVLGDHRRGDLGARHDRRAKRQAGASAQREDIGERHRGAWLGVQLFHLQHRVRRHAVLLPAGADHSEHRPRLSKTARAAGKPGGRKAGVIAVGRRESTRSRRNEARPQRLIIVSFRAGGDGAVQGEAPHPVAWTSHPSHHAAWRNHESQRRGRPSSGPVRQPRFVRAKGSGRAGGPRHGRPT